MIGFDTLNLERDLLTWVEAFFFCLFPCVGVAAS